MVHVSEQASYDIDIESIKSSQTSVKTNDFHEIKINNTKSRRSKFVATCYCSRRPGLYHF